MKFSLRFNNDVPAREYGRLALAAERAGFDQFWVSNDLFLRSAFAILPAVALATERIAVGSCILNPYTVNPAELAMFAATLDELSGGRFLLGLGAGAGDFLRWVGVHQHGPLDAMRETVSAIGRLLACEPAPADGRFLRWEHGAYLRFPIGGRVPIYLGATSPKMLALIGELADGGLPLLFPPEHYATVLPLIRAGAERAGRDADALDIAACIWCSVGDDRAAAEAALRDKIAYYGHALSPMILERLGVDRTEFAPIERALHVERDALKARALVSDAMLRIGVVGTTAELIGRLEGLVALGANHLSFGPPLGPDPLRAIELLGREVLPHFRS